MPVMEYDDLEVHITIPNVTDHVIIERLTLEVRLPDRSQKVMLKIEVEDPKVLIPGDILALTIKPSTMD